MSGGLLGKKIYHRTRLVDYALSVGDTVFVQDTPRDAKIVKETYFTGRPGIVVSETDDLINVKFDDGGIQGFTPGSGLSTDMTVTFPSYLWNNEAQAMSHWETDREYAGLWKEMLKISGSKELRAHPELRPDFSKICDFFTDSRGRGIPHATDAIQLEMMPDVKNQLVDIQRRLQLSPSQNVSQGMRP